MDDDAQQLYLTLKFNSIDAVTAAFKKAIREPEGYLIKNPASDRPVVAGLQKWTEQGCPEIMKIAPEDVELFLIIKFGSLEAAYNWWVRTPPGIDLNLNDAELLLIMDYIPDERP